MIGPSVGIFKLRCPGEKWYDVASHPAIFKTALQAQIALDESNDVYAARILNLLPTGLGVTSKERMSWYIASRTANTNDNSLVYLINQWDEYWDIL